MVPVPCRGAAASSASSPGGPPVASSGSLPSEAPFSNAQPFPARENILIALEAGNSLTDPQCLLKFFHCNFT